MGPQGGWACDGWGAQQCLCCMQGCMPAARLRSILLPTSQQRLQPGHPHSHSAAGGKLILSPPGTVQAGSALSSRVLLTGDCTRGTPLRDMPLPV
jgi:hypothetical protein